MSRRVVFVALLLGCAGDRSEPLNEPSASEPERAVTPAPGPADVAPGPSPPTGDSAQLVATVAREYKSWRLADDEFHWAPGLCRMPRPGGEHMSAAGAEHGGKLFRLWALDVQAYGVAVGWTDRKGPSGDRPSPRVDLPRDVTQVLVKESFVAEQAHGDPQPLNPAMRDGKPFRAGDPIGLFVMIQLATPREGTDQGWIYGTVAPDGTVSSARDSGACRDCHATRPNRLFGIRRPPALGM